MFERGLFWKKWIKDAWEGGGKENKVGYAALEEYLCALKIYSWEKFAANLFMTALTQVLQNRCLIPATALC